MFQKDTTIVIRSLNLQISHCKDLQKIYEANQFWVVFGIVTDFSSIYSKIQSHMIQHV